MSVGEHEVVLQLASVHWRLRAAIGIEFGPLSFAQTDPWAAAVFVDEIDAGSFESRAHYNGSVLLVALLGCYLQPLTTDLTE